MGNQTDRYNLVHVNLPGLSHTIYYIYIYKILYWLILLTVSVIITLCYRLIPSRLSLKDSTLIKLHQKNYKINPPCIKLQKPNKWISLSGL